MSKKQFVYEVKIKNTIDNSGVKKGVDELERELSRTEKRQQEQLKWIEKNWKKIEAAMKAAEMAAKISAQAFTDYQKMVVGLNAEVGKLKSNFDALKTSIEAAANAKRKFGNSTGTGGGGGSGGKNPTVAPKLSETERAANKAASMVLKLDNSLAKLKGNDTELAKLNRQLAMPGVVSKIDDTTKAILRQKAALVDAEKAANQNNKKSGSSGLFASLLSSNLAARAISEVSGAALSGGQIILDYSSRLEQAKIGFTTMTGSAVLAQKHLEDLQKFAAQTPFEFAELVEASQKLQGVGVESEKVIPLLKDVGNALSAAGRIGDLPFAIKALGDIQAKGRLAGQEIIQLANAGLPALDILSKSLGKSRGEILKMSEQGKISADTLFNALHEVSESRFGDALSKQSRTFQGAMSNVKDALLTTASTAFKPVYDEISNLAVNLADDVTAQGGDLSKVGEKIAGYIGQGIGYGATEIGKGLVAIVEDYANGLQGKKSVIGTAIDNFFTGVGVAANKATGYALVSQKDIIAAGLEKPALKASESVKTVNDSLSKAGSIVSGMPSLDKNLGLEKTANSLVGITEKVSNLKTELEKINKTDSTAFKFLNSPYSFKAGENGYTNPSTTDKLFGSNFRANPLTPVESIFGNPRLLSSIEQAKKINEKIKGANKGLPQANLQEAEREQKLALINAENSYKKQDALLNSHIAYTLSQQLAQLKQSQNLEVQFSNKQLSIQKNGFAKQLAAVGDDVDKREKIIADRNETLAKLSGDLEIKQIKNIKEIADIENRIFDERRQNYIEYQNLTIQQTDFGNDKLTYAIENGLKNQTVSIQTGYDELLKISRDSYFKIAAANREQLNLQLQDKSLSEGQRLNLILKGYLDEQKAAEENSRALKEIEKNRTAAILQEIQDRTEAQLKFISNAQFGADNLSIFGDVGGISSFNNFGKLLEKAKDLKEFFDSSNRGQANYLKNQSDHYGNLLKIAQDSLQKLKSQRDSIIPTESGFATATTDLATGQIIQQVPQFDKRQADADLKITDLQDKVLQYKGISSKFAILANQFNSYADGIDKTYGSLQADVFNLYDSISKGVGNNTVFDQIIEKNYLAQRALEQAALSTKVQGLTNQLSKAQEGLEGGSVAPLEVVKIQSELSEAEQALKAFNFQTDVGKEKLDTLTNAAARFKKIISGDKIEIEAIKQFGKTDLEKQKGALAAENIILEQKYYTDSELLALQRRNKLLNYERDIFDTRQELAQKSVFNELEASAKILAHIEQNTTSASDLFANAFINAFDKISEASDKLLNRSGIGKIPIIGDIVKAQSRNLLGSISQTLLGDIFPDIGNSSNPLLNENQKQTKSLQNIEKAVTGIGSFNNIGGGSTASNVLSGGGIAGLLKKAISFFTGNRGGSNGVNSTPPFVNNLTTGGGGSGGSRVAGILDFFNENGTPKNVGGSKGLSSIFGKDGFGNNSGTYSTIGGGISMLGGFISQRFGGSAFGRRLGGILSGAGTGMTIGTMIMPGIGTAIGAAVGGLIGLFTSGGQRKKDEKARTQSINDALAAVDKLFKDVNGNPDFTDWKGVVDQGATIRQSYLDSVSQLKDGKTRNIALKDVSRIDAKLRELETLAKTKAAKTKSRADSLTADIPTFANGGAISNFAMQNFPNGFISGPGTGRSDSILARVSNGEFIFDALSVRNFGLENFERIRRAQGKVKNLIEPQMKFADGGAVGSFGGNSNGSNGSNGATNIEVRNSFVYNEATGKLTARTDVVQMDASGREFIVKTVTEEMENKQNQSEIWNAGKDIDRRHG